MKNILREDAEIILKNNLNWEALKGTKILITGASGMIGSYFARTLVALKETRNWEMKIFALVRNPSKLPNDLVDKVEIIQQSVTEPIETKEKFDYIIHAASPASPLIMREDPVGTIAANTLGTFYTLDLARKSNSKGYLYISSREIYGQPYDGQEEFTENVYGFVDPLSPRSSYPEGKKAAETMCVSFAQQYGLDVKIARLAHTYGPGMSIDDGRVQADFVRDVVNNRDIVLKSEGKPIRTYTYISDAVAAMLYIMLESKDVVYNISSPESTVSIKELAQTLVDIYPERNLHLVFDIPKAEGNTGTAPFTLGILNSDKLQAIGWKPIYSIADGFKRTVEYLEEL